MKRLVIYLLILLFVGGAVLLFSNDVFIFIFSKQVWAHKVNTVQKKKETSQKFSGIELDIVYDQEHRRFDVNHPPDPSINLSLEDYLKAEKKVDGGYWFDLKNLSAENEESASGQLDSIIEGIGLNKSRMIVESQNYRYLTAFAKKGFAVSYYLPSLYQMTKDSLSRTIREINEAILHFPEMYISSNYRDYYIMKEHFPQRKKLLWWKGNIDNFWSWKNKIRLYRIMNDKTVKVLLVPFKSKLGDR